MRYTDFVDSSYRPTKNDLLCVFRVEPAARVSFREAAGGVAAESSIGTWTALSTMTREIERSLKPSVYSFNKKTRVIKIAYSPDLFEAGNVPQILSSIAGNVFGMRLIKNLRLLDVKFPSSIVKAFKGPAFGIQGIRKLVGVKKRPLCGTIVKPKLGLTAEKHARVAFEAWVGGLDLVKDDENLTSMKFNPFKKRVRLTLKAMREAERETGEEKIYACNVTAESKELVRRARFIKENGGNCAMIDILTAGWSAFQTLRDENLHLVIHGHRAGHAALTRNTHHGIHMKVIAKFARLIGVDELHIGSFGAGKMLESPTEDKEIQKALVEKLDGKKLVLTVCSGGLYPGCVPALIKRAGKNIVVQAGGGVHGHEAGTFAGARALRQAIDAAMKEISLKDYAKKHEELSSAIKKWGVVRV